MIIKVCKSYFLFFIFAILFNYSKLKIIHSKIRFIAENNYFLQDDIMRSKKNELINKYLSTKYLFWSKGFKGENIKLAIMDSGINNKHLNCNLKKSKNFSDDKFDIDYIGHGTYLSSIICSEELGISPKISLYMYKIFNKEGDTNTNWIINALKEVLNDGINILNMSFGGINFNDEKIILLIKEIINKNIIIISSSGNEGPSFGSISFPGNNINIITVGGVSKEIFTIYKFTSRGPAMFNKNLIIPKPNTWSLGENIIGFSHKEDNNNNDKYVIKNGSSVSSAIVSSFIALFLSMDYNNINFWNNAKLIEIIRVSNIELPEVNQFERFSGLFNPQGLFGILNFDYKSLFLEKMKLFNYDYFKNYNMNNQRYFDNYSYNMEIYSTKQPVNVPLIVLNFMDKKDYDNIKLPYKFEISVIKKKNKKDDLSDIITDNCIKLKIENIENISLIFLLNIKIIPSDNPQCNFYKQTINWNIKFLDSNNTHLFNLYYSFDFIPKPLKYYRILFDHYHQLIYPFDGPIAKDYLLNNYFEYDWTYENMDTNFYSLKQYILENEEYYIEETNEPLSCLNLQEYSVLLIIDTEKKMSLNEINKLKYYYENHKLSIFIISEWNNILISSNLNYPNRGVKSKVLKEGANLSNLNSFLLNYNIGLTKDSISGEFYISNKKVEINSASSIGLFPENGILFGGVFSNDEQFISNKAETKLSRAILGLYENKFNENFGRIAIFTDSYCIDDYQLSIDKKEKNCFWLFKDILTFLIHGNYVYNNLNLLNSKLLTKTYFNNENIQYDILNNELNDNNQKCVKEINIKNKIPEIKVLKFKTNNFSNEEITMIIPNILGSELSVESLINSNNILEMIKGLLVIFIPIFGILIIMLIIIKCKVENNRRKRISAIQTLGEIRPLMIRIKDRKRMNSICSDSPLSLEEHNEKV